MSKNHISSRKCSNKTTKTKLKPKHNNRIKFNARSKLKSELPREFDEYKIERCKL